jgi:hypothetical protein
MKDLMKKFNMDELKPVSTPMSTTTSLDQMKMVRLWTRGSIGA